MYWDRLFEDLEGQLAAEWEAERAALDAEAERLRISKLDLHSRLRALAGLEATVRLTVNSGARWDLRIDAVGADWIGTRPTDMRRSVVIPASAIVAIELDHGALLHSLDDSAGAPSALAGRMTFGYVLRDLARRRAPVTIGLRDGSDVHGSIDRAGADHLDLAVHDAGEPRRMNAVQAFRVFPYDAVTWVSTALGSAL